MGGHTAENPDNTLCKATPGAQVLGTEARGARSKPVVRGQAGEERQEGTGLQRGSEPKPAPGGTPQAWGCWGRRSGSERPSQEGGLSALLCGLRQWEHSPSELISWTGHPHGQVRRPTVRLSSSGAPCSPLC